MNPRGNINVADLRGQGIEIRAHYDPLSMAMLYGHEGVRFRIARVERGEQHRVFVPEWREVKEELVLQNDMQDGILSVGGEQCQKLMDDLFRIGFRPTDGQGSAGQMDAVQKHLLDMRCLVAKKYGVGLFGAGGEQ